MHTQPYRADLDVDLYKAGLVLKRRWLPASLMSLGIAAVVVWVAMQLEPSYRAMGKVLVKIDRTPALTGLDTSGPDPIGKLNPLSAESNPVITQVETITSLPIAEAAIAQLQLKDAEGEPLSPTQFFKQLKVKSIAGTDLIRIEYEAVEPELAAAVVNQVIESYQAQNVQTNQRDAIAAQVFLNRQIPAAEAAVRKADGDLKRFKEQNQLIVLDVESQETVKAMKRLEDQVTEARSQLATLNLRSQELQRHLKLNPTQAARTTSLSQSSSIQETLAQLRRVEEQLDLKDAVYQPNHPEMQKLAHQRANLQSRLRDRIGEVAGVAGAQATNLQMGSLGQALSNDLIQAEVERISLQGKLKELNRVQSAQQQRASLFPRFEAQQRELERRLTVAQTAYASLLQKRQQVQLAQAQVVDNIRVISKAAPPEKPAGVSKKVVVAGGLIAGGLMGLLSAFLLDLCDRSVKTVQEARELLDYPILGAIPRPGLWSKSAGSKSLGGQSFQGRGVALLTDQSGAIAQAYGMLQSNLWLSHPRQPLRVIVVSSPAPDPGKSQVAANLAMAIAQGGNTVLLIDADSQDPQQHQIWGSSNGVGLTQVLEQQVGLTSAVQPLSPGLGLLSFGMMNAAPLNSLNAQRMGQVLETAAAQYDVVIVDAPPITRAADASILGCLGDGTLLVLRPGQVRVEDVRSAKGLLQLSGQEVLGLVVHGVEMGDNPSRYFADLGQPRLLAPRQSLPIAFQSSPKSEKPLRIKVLQHRNRH